MHSHKTIEFEIYNLKMHTNTLNCSVFSTVSAIDAAFNRIHYSVFAHFFAAYFPFIFSSILLALWQFFK